MEKEADLNEKCPHCNGEGKRMEIPDGMTPMMLDCWVCSGKGKVSKEKYEDYKKAANNFKLG